MKFTLKSSINECAFPEVSAYYLPHCVNLAVDFIERNFRHEEMTVKELDRYLSFIYNLTFITEDDYEICHLVDFVAGSEYARTVVSLYTNKLFGGE